MLRHLGEVFDRIRAFDYGGALHSVLHGCSQRGRSLGRGRHQRSIAQPLRRLSDPILPMDLAELLFGHFNLRMAVEHVEEERSACLGKANDGEVEGRTVWCIYVIV